MILYSTWKAYGNNNNIDFVDSTELQHRFRKALYIKAFCDALISDGNTSNGKS